ncbi:glycosyltransferase family 87 protein [Rubricoccus marinus]|uniref:DUF2029 domain-containing protein n=1 Tax=Rubricoccus marinus TaxID=716817 RepID=A0A259U1Y0_9BACT|nr:glycosyltransferase family 87 protein [Rubricoccus marinus]OZC04045.1 hypothetical protein BSZ36_14260 [Rubricoccus marinus]
MRSSEASGGDDAATRARGVKGALQELRRQPHLAAVAALSALWLPVMPVYLAATFYRFALAEPWHFLVDYSWFHEAALRFFSDPLTLYADAEYFYPPPAVLAFWPTTWVSGVAGYIASGPLIFGGLAAAFAWALRLWERETGSRLDRATRIALLITGLASAPVFQNLKYAQVNVLVLLSALAFLHLCQRQRPGWGALALAGGFWLKVLPLALLPLGLGRLRARSPEASDWRRWRGLVGGAAAGWLALPLALLPWVPWALYREYALERFPAFSGLTDPGALSTSIQATVTRLDLPIEIVTASGMMPASPEATLVAGAVGALVVGAAILSVWSGGAGIVRAGLVVLAVLPAVVPLGWEHTFVLAVPLLLVALAEARQRPPLARWVVALCALAFFAQRPPPPMMASLIETLPRACIDLYLARLWMAVLVLVGLGLWRRTLRPSLATS